MSLFDAAPSSAAIVSNFNPPSNCAFSPPFGLQSSSWLPIATPDEQMDWDRLNSSLPHRTSRHCFSSTSKEDTRNGLRTYPPSVFLDPEPRCIPETDLGDKYRWKKCHLLSLPREIRLEIYRYILTDTSAPSLLVKIDRQPFLPCYKLTRSPTPKLKFSHEPRRSSPISLDILRANHFTYEEALPILYERAKFMPLHLDGLLPLFVSKLSSRAVSCIRRVCLPIPIIAAPINLSNDRSKQFTNWAVTCAQVALRGTLREVEIHGDWAVFQSGSNRRQLLRPLCKIKAQKVFVADLPCGDDTLDYNGQFQGILQQTEAELKAEAGLRKQRTEAEAVERAKRNEHYGNQTQHSWAVGHNAHLASSLYRVTTSPPGPNCSDLRNSSDHAQRSISSTQTMEDWCRWAEENLRRMEQDLSLVPGIKQFEKELEEHANPRPSEDTPAYENLKEPPEHHSGEGEESKILHKGGVDAEQWDLVSVRSGTSTPKTSRPESVILQQTDDEEWVDTASTLVGNDGIEKDQSDTETGLSVPFHRAKLHSGLENRQVWNLHTKNVKLKTVTCKPEARPRFYHQPNPLSPSSPPDPLTSTSPTPSQVKHNS
ncbi:uncharacterized protein BDR25DRAFT_394777 [Lindgomyces ingoldianus]|uniref:Uncharacterized protein n=1 Tax=Lindgomyces ingoldianus TaxID=673940 RepID=A0ACB6QNN9_9PLEO|nr:uncharacterized protein BDR25DRAFT_394777 [Lindgomyces ingoldianus]KAF2468521.1 hypothetical protein BDR25DRAFT_394777 [Lindgomyces ingoldianus]